MNQTEHLLTEMYGSVLDLESGIICHQVNCKGKMGAGLALDIRKKFPVVYDDYMRAYNGPTGLQLGNVIWSKINDKLFVASLCAQDRYGRERGVVYTDYQALEKCLNIVRATNWSPVAIPKGMGCTLAGGDWDTVSEIIKRVTPYALILKYQQPKVIDSFAGPYHFLSNFETSPIQMLLEEHQKTELLKHGIVAGHLVFKTVEHYYQAMKSASPVEWHKISQLGTPGATKRAGRKLVIRPDWNSVKFDVMEQGLNAKFQIPELRAKLLATKGSDICEGNNWHDNIWGNCTCPKCAKITGQNNLGKLLMKVRTRIGGERTG